MAPYSPSSLRFGKPLLVEVIGAKGLAAFHLTLCEETYKLIEDDFICSEKGEFEVKGFGSIRLYDLEGEMTRSR